VHTRVCGATLKLDVVTIRTWLFGYDAYKHFTHDIDCDREPKLIMKACVPLLVHVHDSDSGRSYVVVYFFQNSDLQK
jgi:hypothetical protein